MDTQWADLVDEDTIRSSVGSDAFRRGAEYAGDGHVEKVSRHGERALLGTVQGSGRRTYTTLVTANPSATGERWSGSCTCPVSVNCKHVAAVLLTARATLTHPALTERPASAPSGGAWESSIAGIVQEVVEGTDRGEDGIPLALQLEVVGARTSQRRVLLKPVQRGKNGRWVRTGASWRDVENDYGYYQRRPFVGAHREAMRELHGVFQARNRSYYSGERPVHLDELGPAAWRLLDQLCAAGVTMLTSSGGPVLLPASAAGISMDLRRTGLRGDATLQPVVTVDGNVLPAAAVTFVGAPVHGLFLHAASGELPQALVPAAGLLLACLDRPASDQVSRLLQDGQRLHIPAADTERFLSRYYPGLRQVVPVTSSDSSVTLPEIQPPRIALTLTYGPDHDLTLDWAFAYAAGDGHVTRVPLRGPAAAVVFRDRTAEQALLDRLQLPDDLLPRLRTDVGGQLLLVPHAQLSGLDTVTFTQDVLPALRERDDILLDVAGTPTPYRYSQSAPLISVSATDSVESDWFDLGVTVSVDGEQIPFDALFVALAHGQSHLVLDSGTYFSIERPELDQLRRLIEEARQLQDRSSPGLRISAFQADLWDELTGLGVVQSQSERWARSVQGLLDVDRLSPPPVPEGLDAELRPYQLDGYSWLSFLHDHQLGGILADDMGLGKTVQALAMICRAVERGDAGTGPFLVVAPTSVVANWAAEAARFAPGLRVATITETQARGQTPMTETVAGAHVVVTSYALFRIDFEAYAALAWSGLLLDEAQFVKNHQSKAYQCARRLPAPFKLAITGTPLENNLMELWSLLSIVAPGLYPSPQRFSEVYAKPIQRGSDPQRLATLRRRIRPLVRRRTKEQVAADLPPKQEQVLEVALNPRHQRIYQTHLQRERQKVLGLLDDMERNRFAIFRSLTLLRQLSLDPALVDDSYAGVRSSKVDALMEPLGEVVREGHRALVFSQFTSFLRTVRARLDAEGIPYCYLDGRTRDRPRRIQEFRSGDAPVFLISLKAGGFGLNLTEADYCFIMDPWWNPAVEAQAVDRTHRIGQDKTVMVYRLVSAGTIEEKVMELKARKMGLFSRVMDEDALLSAPLSVDDIKGLLGPTR